MVSAPSMLFALHLSGNSIVALCLGSIQALQLHAGSHMGACHKNTVSLGSRSGLGFRESATIQWLGGLGHTASSALLGLTWACSQGANCV